MNPPCAKPVRFPGLSRHFTAMATVAPLIAIVGITSLSSRGTKTEALLPMM
jgi:hypothetical protein